MKEVRLLVYFKKVISLIANPSEINVFKILLSVITAARTIVRPGCIIRNEMSLHDLSASKLRINNIGTTTIGLLENALNFFLVMK